MGLEEHMSSYVLYVEDDGSGFDSDGVDDMGLGLHIMKYRASAVRGHLTITRRQAGGTRVTCTFSPTKKLSNHDSTEPTNTTM